MRAKELMIGDWVAYEQPKGDIEWSEIHLQTLVNMEKSEYLCDHIQPIPITEEILEKNGFVERMYSPYFGEYVSEDRRITFSHLSNTIGKDWYCHIDNEDFETIGGADIQYVHELQHLFNLCEIEKEVIP